MADIVVRPLTADLLEDWLAYFDHDAFEDNPEWAGCYCQWFHFDHDKADFEAQTAEDNRASAVRLIQAGGLRGYLAYMDGRAAGWCQAAPRLEIPNLARDEQLATDDAAEVGSIVCFNVAAACRRRGVAGALLEAACAGFGEQGLRFAEAYPRREAAGDAANYHGPLALYLRAGFEIWREVGDVVIARRGLADPAGSRGD